MDDQPNIFAGANRPEIRIARPVKAMKAQTRARRVQLQIEGRRLHRLLLRPVQPGEAGGECVGDTEFQRFRSKGLLEALGHVQLKDVPYDLSSRHDHRNLRCTF